MEDIRCEENTSGGGSSSMMEETRFRYIHCKNSKDVAIKFCRSEKGEQNQSSCDMRLSSTSSDTVVRECRREGKVTSLRLLNVPFGGTCSFFHEYSGITRLEIGCPVPPVLLFQYVHQLAGLLSVRFGKQTCMTSIHSLKPLIDDKDIVQNPSVNAVELEHDSHYYAVAQPLIQEEIDKAIKSVLQLSRNAFPALQKCAIRVPKSVSDELDTFVKHYPSMSGGTTILRNAGNDISFVFSERKLKPLSDPRIRRRATFPQPQHGDPRKYENARETTGSMKTNENDSVGAKTAPAVPAEASQSRDSRIHPNSVRNSSSTVTTRNAAVTLSETGVTPWQDASTNQFKKPVAKSPANATRFPPPSHKHNGSTDLCQYKVLGKPAVNAVLASRTLSDHTRQPINSNLPVASAIDLSRTNAQLNSTRVPSCAVGPPVQTKSIPNMVTVVPVAPQQSRPSRMQSYDQALKKTDHGYRETITAQTVSQPVTSKCISENGQRTKRLSQSSNTEAVQPPSKRVTFEGLKEERMLAPSYMRQSDLPPINAVSTNSTNSQQVLVAVEVSESLEQNRSPEIICIEDD